MSMVVFTPSYYVSFTNLSSYHGYVPKVKQLLKTRPGSTILFICYSYAYSYSYPNDDELERTD